MLGDDEFARITSVIGDTTTTGSGTSSTVQAAIVVPSELPARSELVALRDAYSSGIAILQGFQEKAKALGQGDNLKRMLAGMSAGSVSPLEVHAFVSASICPVPIDCAKFTDLMVCAGTICIQPMILLTGIAQHDVIRFQRAKAMHLSTLNQAPQPQQQPMAPPAPPAPVHLPPPSAAPHLPPVVVPKKDPAPVAQNAPTEAASVTPQGTAATPSQSPALQIPKDVEDRLVQYMDTFLQPYGTLQTLPLYE